MAIRVAVGQSPIPSAEYLTFARQLGIAGVQFNTPELPGESRWEAGDLIALRETVERAGLQLEAIENIPNHFYDRVMRGTDGRDQQIEEFKHTLRALGTARIPILGMNWMPQSVWRTGLGPFARGGASASAYDHSIASDPKLLDSIWVARRDQRIADAKDSWVQGSFLTDSSDPIGEDEMWGNLSYFLEAVTPVAAEAGVVLAFHPDDPPVAEVGGVAHILRSVDALVRVATMFDSPSLAIDLCLGTVSEMGGEPAVLDAIDRLGALGKIAYVHLRDVRGTVPVFEECFLGEGNYSPLRVIRRLRAVGFSGFILDDHTPGLVGDDPYGFRGRAHALGYIQALLDATG